MVSAINSALSGLAAASKRIEVSANNIANQFSTQSIVDGQVTNNPYTPQRVDQISLSNGGIETKVKDVNPPTTPVYDPENPSADASGVVQLPNVDQAEQLIDQKIASYDYKANLKTIQVQDDLNKSLLDIIS